MLIKILRPDFTFKDERGTLTQLVKDGFHQINVIESCAGALRGNHYHKYNQEAFFVVSGTLLLTAERNGQKESYTFSDGEMFLIPPFVTHSFSFQTETILVSLYDKGVEMPDGSKDIFRLKD